MDEYFNSQMVCTNGDNIVIMMPKGTMTRKEALVLAAWLVSLADRGEFADILKEVQK